LVSTSVCVKFSHLILAKIIKIVATRCQILRLKCTKFYFGWGSAPDPAGGAYSAPPDSLAGFKGPTSKGGKGKNGEWEGRGMGWRRGVEGRGGEGKGKGEGKGEGKEGTPKVWLTPLCVRNPEKYPEKS